MVGTWSTRANALTFIRLLLAPVIVCAVLAEQWGVAAAVFWAAVATDLADGWVARRYGEATPLGAAVDHAVDATFVTSGCAALAWMGILPALLPPLIAIAFLEYAAGSRPARTGGTLRASQLGRWNGIAYYVAVGTPVIRDALGLSWPGAGLIAALGWLLILSTLLSITTRLLAADRGRGSSN